MIDVRLHMLQMVAHHGTITGAARAMSYSPSTVSYQLKSLGKEFGTPLLEHHGRHVQLTRAAKALLEHVEVIVAEWERARADVATFSDETLGNVTIAAFSSAASALLPHAMQAFKQEYPDTVVRAVEAEPEHSLDMLLAGTADIGLIVVTSTTPPVKDSRFNQRFLIDDPLDLMVPREHPLATKTSVPLQETKDEDWIVGHPGSTYHQLVLSACSAAGFAPYIAHNADEWDTGAALVEAGFGICLISRLSRGTQSHSVARIPLRGTQRPSRRIVAITRAGSDDHAAIRFALDSISDVATDLMSRLADDLHS